MIGAIIRIAVAAIATLIAGLALLVHTPFFRKEALAMIESAMERSIHGGVSLGRLDGILLHRATLRGVEIRDSEGRPVIEADMVRVDPDLIALIRDHVLRFDSLQLVGPRVHLSTDEEGRLNLSRLFET